ncbi:hypothetical protein B0T25DRAFT_540396 [Lasiosphaeria hispida]|uniref:Uncharacterized protein n=1 Tax=Lasiosphaeria hispida TaxID=260671 RepID=A0AAJ0HNI2_9PEZI|nr:hypothetical protein B0T25DRAFT_540396 [Lasiosphaeria hispida]
MWPRKISAAYDRLRGADGDDAETQPFTDGEAEKQDAGHPMSSTTPRPRSWMHKARSALAFTLGIFCGWILLVTAWRTTLHPVPRTVQYTTKTLECGNTTAEAEARGCSFDLLSHNWVPPPCLDSQTESEYRAYISSPERALGAYPYFLDAEGTKRVESERAFALLANGHPVLADQHVYTTREEHLAHCKFLLRRTHRAAQRKVRLNDENAGFWHTEHCLEELSHPNRKPLAALNEGFFVGYSPCTIEVPV